MKTIKQWLEEYEESNNILWANDWQIGKPYYELGIALDITNWCLGIGFDFDPGKDLQFTMRLGPSCWYFRREKHAA